MKKGLKQVEANVVGLAKGLPSQKSVVKATPAQEMTKLTITLRKGLHRELREQAFKSDRTLQGFIMEALQDKGLSVTDNDIRDLRKRGG